MTAIADRFRVIDIDTHIAEPENLWTSRVASKWGDRVPHVEHGGKAIAGLSLATIEIPTNADDDVWVVDGKPVMPTGLLAWSGHDDYWPQHPSRLPDAHPAAFDAKARVALMDEVGVHAMAIFPNIGSSRLYVGMARTEPELALECCRAYNDFLSEWCAEGSGRLLAQTALPLWDVDECAREIQRCAAQGHKAVMMTHQPDGYGLPWMADPHWNPVWETAQEAGLPVVFHIDAARPTAIWPDYGPERHLLKTTVMGFLNNSDMIMDVILSGLCHRYPELGFVSVESGAGYIPYVLESMDWQWLNLGMNKRYPELDLLPSEYFRRQVYGSFWFEQNSGLGDALRLYPDNMLYETDFPHPTSISPGHFPFSQSARDSLEEKFAAVEVSDEILRKVLQDNAAKLYGIDV